jgi:hypothetical protein
MDFVKYFKGYIFDVMEHKSWDNTSFIEWTINVLNFKYFIFQSLTYIA